MFGVFSLSPTSLLRDDFAKMEILRNVIKKHLTENGKLFMIRHLLLNWRMIWDLSALSVINLSQTWLIMHKNSQRCSKKLMMTWKLNSIPFVIRQWLVSSRTEVTHQPSRSTEFNACMLPKTGITCMRNKLVARSLYHNLQPQMPWASFNWTVRSTSIRRERWLKLMLHYWTPINMSNSNKPQS